MQRKGMILLGLLASATWVSSASAQQTGGASEGRTPGGIEDIVVTARKVEENLQTTPVAVTALNGTALEQKQVTTTQDLQRTAPGLVIGMGSASNTGFTFVSIRGQGNLTPIIANDPAVATYMDGVYIARPSQGITDFYDLERVEVLRGPQGTLFGRNTTGGALNILSKNPKMGASELEARAELGNYDFKRFNVIANLPVGENLAARFVYNFSDRGGYGHNRTLGIDAADNKSQFFRGKIRYEGKGFDLTLSGDYNRITDNNQFAGLTAFNPASFPAGSANAAILTGALHTKDNWYSTYGGSVVKPTDPRFNLLPADVQAMYGKTPFDVLTSYGFSGTVNVDLGFAQFKSLTGYRHMVSDGLFDTDNSPAPILATFGGSTSRQISEELQLAGDITDQLSYITGGYASRETGFEYAQSQLFGTLLRNNFGRAENITKGLYAQAYYRLSDSLRAVAGFRYTWDTRNSVLQNRAILGLPGDAAVASSATGFNCTNSEILAVAPADKAALAGACAQPQDAKFHYPAWTAGLDWQASQGLFLYVKTSGAAKAGGWNLRAGSLPAFKPERVKDVEAGIKTDLLDRRLRINIALFHTWKSQVQSVVNALVPGVGVTQYIQNNGDARIWGAEFEVTAAPWEGMEINANMSLQNGKYKSGTFNEVQRIASASPLTGCVAAPPTAGGVPQFDCTVDLSGETLPQLPKTQLNIGASQTLPVADGELSLHIDYAYVSGQLFNTAVASDQQPIALQQQYAVERSLNKISGYGLVNGRIGYTFDAPPLEVYVFGRNLLNNKYSARAFADLYRGVGFAIEYPGPARMLGAGISWKFGQ